MGTVNAGRVQVERPSDRTVVVRLHGEIDLAVAPGIESEIRAGLPGHPTRIVFDLADLTFMDSSGLAVLLRLADEADAVAIRNPTAGVVLLIEATGLDEVLPVDRA